ncbi:MAG: hypothetical protein WEH44_08040 [Pirellulaceae bacterium]
MRNLILTAVATAALLVGGLTWTDTAEARPRGWYRGGAPAVRYYRPYYGYRAYNPYYGYRSYYRSYYRPYGYPYGSYYYGRPYIGGRVYFNWR